MCSRGARVPNNYTVCGARGGDDKRAVIRGKKEAAAAGASGRRRRPGHEDINHGNNTGRRRIYIECPEGID